MKTICKVINILCLILSILGFGVAAVFIITDKTGDIGFLNDITKIDLWIILICLLATTVSYVTLLFNNNKGICIGGIIGCLLFSFQSYGAAIVIGMGFMLNVIYLSYLDGKVQKEVKALPIVNEADSSINNSNSEELVQDNNVNDNYNDNVNNTNTIINNDRIDDDYRPYMKPYYIYFILSIVLSISYMVLLVMGCISIVDYFRNSKDGVYVLLFALAVPFLGIIALALAVDIIYGLVASILALAAPSKAIMTLNSVMGFLSLTFFNAIGAISIMSYVEDVVKNNNTY